MTTHVEAILTNGVLKPDHPLPQPDQTRVRLTIEPIEPWSAEGAKRALDAIQARLKERPIDSGGVRYTRDELHERR
jgi:predicted DNA-binding antitoxin AbrB/MazE fold protein